MFSSIKVISFKIMLVLFFASCSGQNRGVDSIPIRYSSSTEIYQRDSFYIAATLWQFIEKKVDIFDFYKQYNIPLNEVRVDVDSIFYSPDSLKLFSFVIISVPDYQNNNPNNLYYNGEDIIGYRNSKKEPWTIYYFGQIRPTGLDNYNKIRNILRNYYLGNNGKFKNDYDSYWDGKLNDTLGMARSITFPHQGNRINVSFGYNIDDIHFWDRSIVWKKGSRIPGYYAFQTKGNVAPGYSDNPIKIIPPLDYPDSLLMLYKEMH